MVHVHVSPFNVSQRVHSNLCTKQELVTSFAVMRVRLAPLNIGNWVDGCAFRLVVSVCQAFSLVIVAIFQRPP